MGLLNVLRKYMQLFLRPTKTCNLCLCESLMKHKSENNMTKNQIDAKKHDYLNWYYALKALELVT